jgi:hypothetical protein
MKAQSGLRSVGRAIGDWDTGGGVIEFDLLRDGDSEGDEDEESSIWIGDRRQKP